MATPPDEIGLPFGPDSAPRYRQILEDYISKGINVSNCHAALAALDKLPPDAWVEKTAQQRRIDDLGGMLNSPDVPGKFKINIASCIELYKAGVIQFEYGTYYVLRDGKLVDGPGKIAEFDEVELLMAPDRGNLWVEKCVGRAFQMPSYSAVIPTSPLDGHHYVRLV